MDQDGKKVIPVKMTQLQVNAFNNILSNYFGDSKVSISYSGSPGTQINFNGVNDLSSFSETQLAVYEELSMIFNDPEKSINISFTNAYPELGVDDYHTSMINTEAMLAFDQVQGSGEGRSGMALLFHGLTEQWSKQVIQGEVTLTENTFGGDKTFDGAHIYALSKETLVTGLIALGGGSSSNGTSTLSTVHYFSPNLSYQFSILEGYKNNKLEKLIKKNLNINLSKLDAQNQNYGKKAADITH